MNSPFLYRNRAGTISKTGVTMPRLLLTSGPFMGKTTLLMELARAGNFAVLDGSLVAERDELTLTALLDWENTQGQGLLIDNLDKALPEYAAAQARVDSKERDQPPRRVIATSRDQIRLAELVGRRTLGRSQVPFRSEPLNPFPVNWEQNLSLGWTEAWQDILEVMGVDDAGRELYSGSNQENTSYNDWVTHVATLTHGHPHLVGLAFNATAMAFEIALAEGQELDFDTLQAEKWLESQLLDEALPSVEESISWVLSQNDGLARVLCEDTPPHGLSVLEEKLLRSAGLVRGASDDLGWVSPDVLGRLVREQVSGRGAASQALRVQVRADPRQPDLSGVIEAFKNNQLQSELRVRGRGWRILQLLDANSNQVVSLSDLMSVAEGGSEQSVRSAIQRMQERLKQSGLSGVLANEHGRGYRLSTGVS